MVSHHKQVFGIDLGYTNTRIAYVNEYGNPVIVSNAEGQHVTPSVVQFSGDERIVGKAAKESAVLYPDQTVELIKRFMGDKDYSIEYEGHRYGPEEISAYILRKVVGDAELQTGMKITDVVITIPAYFDIPEREATANAGRIAGLNVLSIINEPTAAAITYWAHEKVDQTLLVYDLGGVTFDITVIRIENGRFTIIADGGAYRLGGRDWDNRIMHYFAEEWRTRTGSTDDPLSSNETLQDLFNRAEQAKITLTGRTKADVPIVHAGQRVRVTLTRERFDELTSDLLERTIGMTNQLLQQATERGITKFDQLLLVGGSTHMPQVSARLREEFGREPILQKPDESVAIGAAIYAHMLRSAPILAQRPQRAAEEVAAKLGLKPEDIGDPSDTNNRNQTSHGSGGIVEQPERINTLAEHTDTVPVNFTAYAPERISSGMKYGMYLYAHIDSVRALVREDVERFVDELGGAIPLPRFASNTARLKIGTPLTIVPNIEAVEFTPTIATQDWNGEINRFDFELMLNKSHKSTLEGTIEIYVFGILIATIALAIDTFRSSQYEIPENSLAAAKLRSSTAQMYQRIFVSYSRKDREIVEYYRLAQMALGNDVFMDTYSIRSGEDWEAALAKGIDSAQIMQLFWSDNSAKSPNVQEEWQYALRFKCGDSRCENFIRPVYWLNPLSAPPSDLAHLNFRFVELTPSNLSRSSLLEGSLPSLTTQETDTSKKRLELQISSLLTEVERINQTVNTLMRNSQELLSEVADLKRQISGQRLSSRSGIVENFTTRDNALPAKFSRDYVTLLDNQKQVSIKVMGGLSDKLLYSADLGFELAQLVIDLPPDLPAGTPFRLTMELDDTGVLKGTATIGRSEIRCPFELEIDIPTQALSNQVRMLWIE